MYEFSNTQTYDLIAEGDYETVLEAGIEKTTDGRRYIKCKFLIRYDVEQPCKGRVIFDNIWPDRTNPERFDHNKLQQLLLIQGENGTYKFADDEALVQFINGLNVVIHIEKKTADQYHNTDYNQIKYCYYKPTKHAPKTIDVTNNLTDAISGNFTISEDDLPF